MKYLFVKGYLYLLLFIYKPHHCFLLTSLCVLSTSGWQLYGHCTMVVVICTLLIIGNASLHYLTVRCCTIVLYSGEKQHDGMHRIMLNQIGSNCIATGESYLIAWCFKCIVNVSYRGNVSRCASHRPQWWRCTSLVCMNSKQTIWFKTKPVLTKHAHRNINIYACFWWTTQWYKTMY